MIYSYQKHTDALSTIEMILPEDEYHHRIGTELATVDGITYVHLPDNTPLPIQPPEISVGLVVLTPEVIEMIKSSSPHARLIDARIKAKIRDKYDAETEMYFARISIGAVTGLYTMEPGEAEKVAIYGAYVEDVRRWGREQRAMIGL